MSRVVTESPVSSWNKLLVEAGEPLYICVPTYRYIVMAAQRAAIVAQSPIIISLTSDTCYNDITKGDVSSFEFVERSKLPSVCKGMDRYKPIGGVCYWFVKEKKIQVSQWSVTERNHLFYWSLSLLFAWHPFWHLLFPLLTLRQNFQFC